MNVYSCLASSTVPCTNNTGNSTNDIAYSCCSTNNCNIGTATFSSTTSLRPHLMSSFVYGLMGAFFMLLKFYIIKREQKERENSNFFLFIYFFLFSYLKIKMINVKYF